MLHNGDDPLAYASFGMFINKYEQGVCLVDGEYGLWNGLN